MSRSIDVRSDGAGSTVRVKVKARSRRVGILGERGDALYVGVAAPREKGKANRALLETLAGALELAKSDLEIVTGQTHPEKVIHCRGIDEEELRRRLERALAAAV